MCVCTYAYVYACVWCVCLCVQMSCVCVCVYESAQMVAAPCDAGSSSLNQAYKKQKSMRMK
jgi:hypothetical protein